MNQITRAIGAVLLGAGLLGASCGESLKPEEIAGRYTLARVNGIDVPDLVPISEDYSVEILGGWWQVDRDETWSSHLETADTAADNSGTYEIKDLFITFSDGTGLTTTGTVMANGLTIQDAGIVWYFVK